MIKYLRRLSDFIIDALVLQCMLFSMSFPILVSWGIMWSPLVFLGTLLFSPFLSLFLALSAIIFITELLYMPNTLLIRCLEWFTDGWMWLMEWAPVMPKIGYVKGPLIILILLPLGAVVLMWQLGGTRSVTLVGLAVWLAGYLGAYGAYWRTNDCALEIPIGSRSVACIIRSKEVVLIDNHDTLKGRACSPSWVRFTLLPTLIKSTGTCRIDRIIVPCVSKRGLDRLIALCTLCYCREIVCLECSPELALQVGKENIRLTVLPNGHDTIC